MGAKVSNNNNFSDLALIASQTPCPAVAGFGKRGSSWPLDCQPGCLCGGGRARCQGTVVASLLPSRSGEKSASRGEFAEASRSTMRIYSRNAGRRIFELYRRLYRRKQSPSSPLQKLVWKENGEGLLIDRRWEECTWPFSGSSQPLTFSPTIEFEVRCAF